MYSEKRILKNLDSFASREGWMPVAHSLDQVNEFIEYIKKITTISTNARSSNIQLKANLTQQRAKDIRRWVENEQAMCAMDSSYFESRYAWVIDHRGEVFKFQNRKAQKVFDDLVAEHDELVRSIEFLILKARQLGVTTKTALKFVHRVLFVPHTQAVMGSVILDKSELIQNIIETCIDRLPWWLVPNRLKDTKKLIGFGNGSMMSIQSGTQATGIAQGWTPTCLTRDSLVRLHSGFVKKISEIDDKRGTRTLDGRTVRITKAWKTSREPQSTRLLKIWGFHSPLECTPDHKIWTNRGWVEAAELSVGDTIRHPVIPITRTLRKGTAYSLPRGFVSEKRKEYFKFNLTPEVGYLCGFYLAEGFCHRSGHGTKKTPYLSEVVFSIHKREIERTVEAIKAVVGHGKIPVRVKERRGNGAYVTVSCAWLTRWLSECFGEKEFKRVPEWIWEAGRSFCEAVLRGYMDGDGHCELGKNTVRAPSVCHQITLGMRDLIASLGLGWSSIYQQEAREGHREAWYLVLTGKTAIAYRRLCNAPKRPHRKKVPHWKYDSEKRNIDVQIESVSDGFRTEFWDVEVGDPTHSFSTPQCVVHNCIHLSEIGDIPNPKKTIEEGLLPAAHSSSKLFLILEGTGNGSVGWQADKWRACKEDWPKGLSRLRPVFVPWPMAPDLYPEPDWLRSNPVPGDWIPMEATRKHVKRCELYIHSTDYLERVVGKDWRMPREQQWFWEFKYREYARTHSQKIWLSQMPADDYEALQGKNDLVFDPIVVETINTERKQEFQAYAITGNSIDDGFEPNPDEIDYNLPRIRVEWTSHRAQRYDWLLIPLKPFEEANEKKSLDKVLIFEEPNMQPGHEGEPQDYSIGIDTADGLGHEDEERSTLCIVRSMKGENCDEQAAELCSNRINAPQMVGFAACLAAWYGKNTIDPRGCKFAIEQRERPGDDCQLQLKLMGFKFHHIDTRYDNKDVKENKGHKEGWFSTAWSVPMLMNRFIDAIVNGWFKPNSRYLIAECGSLERKLAANRGKSKLEHQSGKFDDRVRAAAQAYFTRHAFDVMADRANRRYRPPTTKLPELIDTPANMALQEYLSNKMMADF